MWCRPKTLGCENQQVEWKDRQRTTVGVADGGALRRQLRAWQEEPTEDNCRCGGGKDHAEDNCGCVGALVERTT